jgi:hypothetical protein
MAKEIPDVDWFACGSRVTCDPAPTDTDEDWLLTVASTLLAVEVGKWLVSYGWVKEGTTARYSNDKDFISYRAGELNFIVTSNPEFSKNFKLATGVCKQMNILEKEDRRNIFEAIMNYKPKAKVAEGFSTAFPWSA